MYFFPDSLLFLLDRRNAAICMSPTLKLVSENVMRIENMMRIVKTIFLGKATAKSFFFFSLFFIVFFSRDSNFCVFSSFKKIFQ